MRSTSLLQGTNPSKVVDSLVSVMRAGVDSKACRLLSVLTCSVVQFCVSLGEGDRFSLVAVESVVDEKLTHSHIVERGLVGTSGRRDFGEPRGRLRAGIYPIKNGNSASAGNLVATCGKCGYPLSTRRGRNRPSEYVGRRFCQVSRHDAAKSVV